MEETPLVNRIANSPLITIDLEKHAPSMRFKSFDLKDFLFMEMILKEKDFRESLKTHDWTQYKDLDILIFCSADAIIPMWAYMLVASKAEGIAANIYQMTPEDYHKQEWMRAIDRLDISPWKDKKLIIKGCSVTPVPPIAYARITERLQPIADSIMFGEACSTVPIYKKVKK